MTTSFKQTVFLPIIFVSCRQKKSLYISAAIIIPAILRILLKVLRPVYTGDFCGDSKSPMKTSGDFIAISSRFVATKSPPFRTCSNFEAIYWQFFQFESSKNLLWCTLEGSLSQTWRMLLVTRPQKRRQKRRKLQRKQENLVALR